jgi:Holliday junction resolvasome RuvABC endonuclease subunit
MINVIGLDLSITASGVCLADNSAVTLKPKTTGDARFVEIPDRITEFCRAARIGFAVIEKAPPGLRGHADSIYGVQAVVRAALIREGIPYAVVDPNKLKKFATGAGTGDKMHMAVEAFKRAGVEFTDNNGADAWWLRCAGLWVTGHLFFDLPKAQCDALKGTVWPDLDLARVA